ncbi:TPA: hypothetical protein ACH3X1_004693 [Trebouxia sp. C0004]
MLQTHALCYPAAAAGLVADNPVSIYVVAFQCQAFLGSHAVSYECCTLSAACCFFAGCRDCAATAHWRALCCHPQQTAPHGPPERLSNPKSSACIRRILNLLQTARPA